MLLFMDGFDHYATADLAKKWTSVAGVGSVSSATFPRRAGSSYYGSASGSSIQLTKTIAAGSSFVMGVALYLGSGAVSFAGNVFALLDAGTQQCNLRVNTDKTLSVTRNGTVLTNGTSASALTSEAWNYIEWKVTISDSISANTCKVRVNGADWIIVATGQDTKNTSNATANQVQLAPSSFGAGFYVDDFYLCDQSGSAPTNDFLGDVRIDTLFPNGNGTYSQFAGSDGNSTDNYLLVDETAPNTTDYVDGSSVGDRDSYAMGNLAALASQTVYGVQVNAAILKDDAGSKSAATFVRSGSTNSDGASVALGTSQTYISQIFETDPNTSSAWTETTVNAMEAGVKVTA